MNKQQILDFIELMSMSQGFYGRLLRDITNKDLEYLERQNFKDHLDLILFLES
ncbi:MAG: putative acetyltransferase [Candidatus Improbicoccus devescovinae]|nr:MAG: putative acetyltransferase [Candidatus Improbicoccus devescovinae]